MLNIEEINNTIEKLENEETTYSNCSKLANLYIVYTQSISEVKEFEVEKLKFDKPAIENK